jgi:hypothetical protein
LKSVHRRISLADCFAVALSQKLDATLLTSDRQEFMPIDGTARVRHAVHSVALPRSIWRSSLRTVAQDPLRSIVAKVMGWFWITTCS